VLLLIHRKDAFAYIACGVRNLAVWYALQDFCVLLISCSPAAILRRKQCIVFFLSGIMSLYSYSDLSRFLRFAIFAYINVLNKT